MLDYDEKMQFLRGIADEVAYLVEDAEIRERMRVRVQGFEDMAVEFCKAYIDHYEKSKLNSALRDKQAGPPDEGWRWDDSLSWYKSNGCWVPPGFPDDPCQWLFDTWWGHNEPPYGYGVELYTEQRYPQKPFTRDPDENEKNAIRSVVCAVIHDAITIDRGFQYKPVFYDFSKPKLSLEGFRFWDRLHNKTITQGTQKAIELSLMDLKACGKDIYSHSEDFASIRWNGKTYNFNDTQAIIVKLLWAEWEADRGGLHQQTIGEEIGSASDDYRLHHSFRRKGIDHPAWGTVIKGDKSGKYGLWPQKKI